MVTLFQSWRVQLREVETSIKTGRLDEAWHQLHAAGLLEFMPAKDLAKSLSLQFAERAKRRAANGRFPEGWQDLARAIDLADIPACDVARRCLSEAQVAEIARRIAAGARAEAESLLADFERRGGQFAEIRDLRKQIDSLAVREWSEMRKVSPRFLLWVDGVGGYLVCLGEDLLIGQSAPGNPVDIPILGDLSRKHARVRRSGEGYLLEAIQPVQVNGKSVREKVCLCDGDEIGFGAGIRWRYRRPHALSATARLEPLGQHRTHPYADSVLLMAESCVLGPRWTNHVVCRDWSGDVVLSRTGQEVYCRTLGTLTVDGVACPGRGKLQFNSRVVGEDFSMSLEELDKCSNQPLV